MSYAATPVEVRFHRKYRVMPSGCWHWTDAPDRYGYGRLQIKKRAVKAHRISYALHNGDLPADRLVCHSCDNPICVNPAHLFLGTDFDNRQDAKVKGRIPAKPGAPNPGETNGRAKLTDAIVRDLLDRHGRSEIKSAAAEARALGVNPCIVQGILRGTKWKHICR